jgi:O-antigen ligase
VWIASVAFFVVNAAAIVWARSRSVALERTLQIAALTLALWIVIQAVRTRRGLLTLTWIWIAVGAVVAGWTLYQDILRAWWPERLRLVSNLPDWRGYLAASLGNTNHIGDLLALTLLPTLVILGESRRRLPLIATTIAAVLIAAALTVAYSVGSNLGLVLGGFVMLLLVFVRERLRFFRRWRRWAVLGGLWAAMLAFFLTDHPLNPHAPGLLKQGFGSDRWAEGWPTRLAIWSGGLEMVRLHPVLGVGAGNFSYVYPEVKSALIAADPELIKYQGRWTNAAHNVFLQIWSELGIVGLFVFVALLALAFHSLLAGIMRARRPEFLVRMTLAGVLTAWVAHGMMNFALEQPSGAISFYLILGAVIAERASRSVRLLPPLVWEPGPLHLELEWRDMRHPTCLGISFLMPPAAAISLSIILLVGAGAAVIPLRRPLMAQYEYALARSARNSGLPLHEERHLRNALQLDPWATGARSRYSELLVEMNRPEEALAQIKIVRRRLNSSELYDRESRALAQLGRVQEAKDAWLKFQDRFRPREISEASEGSQ